MIPADSYPSVQDSATLRDAISVMEGAELEVAGRKSLPRSVLVFDEINVLVGYIRRRDILLGLEPKFLLQQPLDYRKKLFDIATDPNLLELQYDRVVAGIREQSTRLVSDVMRPIESIVDANDHLVRAAYEMTSNDVALIPVVENGQLVGLLRSVDVFNAVVEML